MTRKKAKRLLLISVSGIFLLGLYFGLLQVDGNFHETIPGEFYRSAQLSPGDITKYVKQYHIRSIINLRGENEDAGWYIAEVAEANHVHVRHYDFHMSMKEQLSQARAEKLIAMMRNAPKPVLVHCQAGSDRTGLATALYIAAVKKGTEFQAETQLSMFYGHIPIPFTKSYAMNLTFEALEPWLGYNDS